jgi:dihydrofolate reductase
VLSKQTITLNGDDKLIQGDIFNEIKEIKKNAQKDIWLFGGAGLISTFLNLDLIDEIRIGINPITIGEGTPLFKEISSRKKFELIKAKIYKSGVVGLYYKPILNIN